MCCYYLALIDRLRHFILDQWIQWLFNLEVWPCSWYQCPAYWVLLKVVDGYLAPPLLVSSSARQLALLIRPACVHSACYGRSDF